MASLTACLLLASPVARAGSYSPAYSGGTYNGLGGQYGAPGTYPDGCGSSGCSGSGSEGGGGASCQGAISTTLTWQPAYTGEPTPSSSSVIITETSTATSQVRASGSDTAKCDDGLGAPGSVQSVSGAAQYSSGPNPQVTGYFAQASASDVRYTAWSGSSLSATPTASVSGTGAQSSGASVTYAASASPVTISLSGTTPDSSGNPNILVGQQCTATINGIPSALLNNTANPPVYKWSVSGTTFESWSVVSDANGQSHTAEVDAIPATQSTQWYWNDPANASETVSCTVTMTPPNGDGSPFSLTVNAPKPVSVQLPGWYASEAGGYMQVNKTAPNTNGTYTLHAGPSAGQVGGMNWTANVMSSALFASGTIELVQLVTPSASYVNYTGIGVPGRTYSDPENGMFGLDTAYPYGWSTTGSYQPPYNPVAYMTDDSPTIGLSSSFASVAMQHQFTDYIMFQPPGSGEWVPLGTATWSTNGNATVPTTDNWGDYVTQNGSDSAGMVMPTNSTNFTPKNAFPSWTRVNVFPNTGTWN